LISLKHLLTLGVATSIDALAVGVSFAFLSVDILLAVFIIGLITFAISFIGVKSGHFLGKKFKSKAEIFGGLVLCFIGKAIFALIPVSFLIGGMSGYLYSSNDSFAAKVNGETISQQDFLNRYNQEFEARAQQEGESFLAKTDSVEFVTALRQNLIQRLVDQELIRQYAKELKLGVSDEMIKRAIVSDPNLQSNGKFDNARYQQLLTQNGLTSDTYAAILRNALTLEQMQNGLADSEFVVPAQVKDNAQVFFQKRIARLATLPLADEIAKQKVTDEEIKAYYDANAKSLVQPEQAKVQYIRVSADALGKLQPVTETQIAQYYQENKAQFISQKLAHIQLSTEKEADADKKALILLS